MGKSLSANKVILPASIILAFIFINSCGKKGDIVAPVVVNNTDTTINGTAYTYTLTVKPLMDKYCMACHANSTYIHLEGYERLKEVADSGILQKRLFTLKDMPPVGSPAPTEAELGKIKKWIDNGCKE